MTKNSSSTATVGDKARDTISNAVGGAVGATVGGLIGGPIGGIIGGAAGSIVSTATEETIVRLWNNNKMQNLTERFLFRRAQSDITRSDAEEIENEVKGEIQGEKTEESNQTEKVVGYSLTGEIAKTRIINTESKKQSNLVKVLLVAEENLDEKNKAEEIDEDWMDEISEAAEKTSNEDIQKLWGKILAQEASRPGTTPKRLIDIVSKMDKRDAKYFEKICSFIVNFFSEDRLYILNQDDSIYRQNGIDFYLLSRLEDIGLIRQYPGGLIMERTLIAALGEISSKHIDNLYYQSDHIKMEMKGNKFNLGIYHFTDEGNQLAKACQSTKKVENFKDYIVQNLKQQGHHIIAEDNKI